MKQDLPAVKLRELGLMLAVMALLMLAACSPQQTQSLGERLGYYDLLGRFSIAPVPLRLLYGLLGGTLLLVGYKLFYPLLSLIGALMGGIVGLAVGQQLAPDNPTAQLLGLLVGGLIGVILSGMLFDLLLLVTGAFSGAILGDRLWIELQGTVTPIWVYIVGAILGAIVLLGLSYVFIVFVASAIGAVMLALALNLGVGWVIVFFVGGLVIQIVIAGLRREPAFVRRRRAKA